MSSAQRFSSRSGTKTLIGKESRTAISDVGALANQVPRFVTRARVSHLLTVPEEEVRQIARDAGLGCVERVGKEEVTYFTYDEMYQIGVLAAQNKRARER